MNASVRGSAARLSSAFVVAALSVLTASAQLNPTVKVLPKPQTSVPPECEQGLAPAVPRVIVAEAQPETKPARAVPPPSLDLKTQLRAVQLAAESGDRDAFKAALADARGAVDSYPRGGERNAANDVLNVYNDLERLWDYEFTSPTGAFFDSSTDFVSMMRRYPDYSRAIGNQTITVNGQTLYPTVETRKFLVAEASKRLANLGVRSPTRIVEVPPPTPAPQPRVTPQPPPVPRAVPEKPAVRKAERTTPRAAKPHRAPHKAARKPATKKAKPPVKIAEATKPSPKPRISEPVPQPVPQPAPPPVPMPTKMPAPVPSVAPAPSVAPPPPAAKPTTSAAEGGGATTSAPAPTPALPTDTMSKPATTETTATTATTAPAQTPAPASGGGRMNLLFAIILIIVGIGVLIILFRASD